MPNFQKSKGFQLRSGNKGGAPFKMMGSSPATYGGGITNLLSAKEKDSTVEKVSKNVTGEKTPKPEPKKIKVADAKFDASKATVSGDAKDNTKTRGKKQNASKIGDTAERSELDVAKSDGRASRKKEKHQKKLDRANETLEQRDARKKLNKEKLGDALGELSDRLDPKNRGLHAKSKAAKKGRVDKNIKNEKDKVDTARTQQLIEMQNKSDAESEKLSTTEKKAVGENGAVVVPDDGTGVNGRKGGSDLSKNN